jgi:hypothetical protein
LIDDSVSHGDTLAERQNAKDIHFNAAGKSKSTA